MDGYKMHRWGGNEAFPPVITIFSAPKYCGSQNNKGAVILIENDKMNVKQYKDVAHPFILPNNQNLFEWSLPFLGDKVTDMLVAIAKKAAKMNNQADHVGVKKQLDQIIEDKKALESKIEHEKTEKIHKYEVIRNKVMAFAKMNLMFKTLHENQSEVIQIKAANHGKLPIGTL